MNIHSQMGDQMGDKSRFLFVSYHCLKVYMQRINSDDITEGGVLGAVWELSEISGVGVELEEDKIPVSEVTRKICDHFGINYLRLISSGCMMIIVHPDREEAVMEAIRNVGVDVTRIGRVMEQGTPRVLIGKDGVVREIDPPESDELYKVVK
jgi:hydrogenase expression/formation protein HypE